MFKSIALAVAYACWAAPVLAETVTAAAAPVSPYAGMLQLVLGLFVVLAAIMASAWLFRRFGRLQTGAQGALRILGGLSLGTRERVVLVEVGETQLLLGVAPGRVQTLHVLDRKIASPGVSVPGDGFAQRLGEALRRATGSRGKGPGTSQ